MTPKDFASLAEAQPSRPPLKLSGNMRTIDIENGEAQNPEPESSEFHIDHNDPEWRPGDIINAIIGSIRSSRPEEVVQGMRYLLSHLSPEQLADLYNKAFGMPYEEYSAKLKQA